MSRSGTLRFAPVALFCIGVMGAQAAETVTVGAELWDRPRTARAVLEHPALKQAINAYLARPEARLVIRHAARNDALLQAEELRGWLAALAVEGSRITLRGGLQSGEPVKIEVATSP